MRKVYIFLSILLLTITFVGCTDNFTLAPVTSDIETTLKVTTTTNEIDKDQLLLDVYEMIYSDIYDEVKEAVMNDLSEERFDEIYDQVVADLLLEIEAGNINVTAESIIDVIQNVQSSAADSVIGVASLSSTGNDVSVGSGVIYKKTSNTYYVVSNHHVVEDGASYEIVLSDGTRITALLKGVDELVDLAVLTFSSELDLEVSSFADSDLVNKGDIVLAVGNPLGFDYYGSITMGIVSGLDRFFDIDEDGTKDMFVDYIQHDAAINNGNSGGALFNINGDIVGINVIKFTATEIEGMGFAIPSNLVSAIVDDIETYGYSRQKPVLGINFVNIQGGSAYFEQEGIIIPEGVTTGFYINSVLSNSTMDGYLNPGDILIAIDDIQLGSTMDFVEAFSAYLVGDIVSITIYNPSGDPIVITDIELLPSVEE